MYSVVSIDGPAAWHVCKWGLIWLTWPTGQDNLPCSMRWGPLDMAGWRARERLWFISAPGTHLAGLVQRLFDQGKVRGCRHPAHELGLRSNSEKRGESSSCWGWYLYNDSVLGRKWNRFCWGTFLPPLPCPLLVPKRWYVENLSKLYPCVCRLATRLQAPQWDVRAKAPYWIPKVPLFPYSQPRTLLSFHLIAFADWGELCCPSATL